MSTKTTFKRVALVAVAALGLGVLSVAPSSATVGTQSITVANGTSTTASNYDSSTGATFSWSARMDAGDTVTVNVAPKSIPTDAVANIAQLRYLDSTSAANSFLGTISSTGAAGNQVAKLDTVTAAGTFHIRSSGSGFVGADFRVELDSTTARTAGTYTFTVTTKVYNAGSTTIASTTDTDVSIVVAAVASESKVASASTSTAVLNAGSTTGSATDSAVAAVATANGTQVANIVVTLKNAAGGGSARESITATLTGAGLISPDNTTFGKSFVIAPSASETTIRVRADGTAGTGTITISTPSVTFAPKTVTFYAATASTAVASVAKSVIEGGSATADTVRVAIKDANGSTWAGAAYIYASSAADALIAGSETPALCDFDAVDARHECSITGKTVGTAKFKVINTATVAAATWTSNEVSVRVATAVPASVKLVFDKASYQPGEKAVLSVVPLDAAGAQMVGKTYANLLATGGITPNISFSTGSDTLTATDIVVSATSSSTSGTTAGQRNYTVYMPFASGDIVVTATGGTGLPTAARVAVTATASVVNASVDAATDAANEATDAANAATDAALAAADAADAATAAAQDASDAVAALSASVSKLISSLRAQITSLTNLVIKIQKKVRA
jgi:trimeric autotransporter adhesin